VKVRLALTMGGMGAEKAARLAAEAVRARYERAEQTSTWVEGEERWFEFEAGRRLVRRTPRGIELRGSYEVRQA